jgi:rhodanese-related sulfurtransferase
MANTVKLGNLTGVRLAVGVLLVLLGLAAVPADAQASTILSAPDAHARAMAGELVLIDIRTPEEWRETGVARGAARIDMRHPGGPRGFAEEVFRRVGGDRNAPIGLICRTGNRTTQVQRALQDLGFTRVYNIKEGMAGSAAGPGWVKRGLPTEP